MLIIASFLLSLSACGYKVSPYYEKDAPIEDENVKFIIDSKVDEVVENNESCE